MDRFDMILPIEKFLPTSVERPDILDVMYQPTEIINTLGAEEFNKIEINETYINNEAERESRKLQYAKEAEERADKLRQIEMETGRNPLGDKDDDEENQIEISDR